MKEYSNEECYDILMEVIYYRLDDDAIAEKVEENPEQYGNALRETIQWAWDDGERDVYDITEKYILHNLMQS